MSYYIPEEVVIEILVRLPVKSIVRFRCVSKSWYSLISSASFISAQTHFATSLARKTNLVLLGDWGICDFSLNFDDQSMGEYKKLNIPLERGDVRIHGSCHGLICLTCWNTIVIWNPALGISLQLPEYSFKMSHYPSNAIGFGFDVRRHDYKIIRIPYPFSSPLAVPTQYEVFELSQNAWKIVTPNKFPPNMCNLPSAFLNGSAHWICELSTIVAFDFADETFMEMNLPSALKNQRYLNIVVKERRYLSAIRYDYPPEDDGKICVWLMKEYGVEDSWCKMFTIHESGMQPIGFRTNGELLVRRTQDDMLVSYDFSTYQVTCIENKGYTRCNFVLEHTETLALLQVPKQKNKALEIMNIDGAEEITLQSE